MGKPSTLRVGFYLFLILSVAPIDAHRVAVNEEAVLQTSFGALTEGEASWHVFATHEENCARWSREFGQRTLEVQEATAQIKAGKGGNLKTARTVLRLRSMTRVYERAAKQECSWVSEQEIDTEALHGIVQENLSENPCFPAAQALMTQHWETQQEQVRAMHMATQFLATKKCTDEDAARYAEELDGPAPEDAEEVSVEEQLAAANEEADSVTDEFVEGLMHEEPSLMQLTEDSSFVQLLTELVGLVAFLLVWAVLCLVFIPVIIMVVGAVLCTLSWVIRRFLSRGRQTNLGTCMNWWAHQTELVFAPGNELITAGACLLAGWYGFLPIVDINANFPTLGIWIRGGRYRR